MARRPANRKQLIVAAASELFAERGFAAVGIDEIAERVGITGPAIYRHFAGKDALLEAIVVRVVDDVRTHLDAASPDDPLDASVRVAVGACLDERAALATFVRERHRLSRGQLKSLRTAEAALLAHFEAMTRSAGLALGRIPLAMRFQGFAAAVSAVASRAGDLPRPRLDELLTESGIAMLAGPPVTQAPFQPEVPPGAALADDGATDRAADILDVALPLFRTRGFAGAGIDELAERIGISVSTLYRWYPSKADILVAAYDRAGARIEALTRAALEASDDPGERLERLVGGYVDVALRSIDLIVVTGREGSALPAEARPRLSLRRRSLRDAWTAVLRELRPDRDAAETATIASGIFPLVNHVVHAVPGAAEHRHELEGLARRFATGRSA